MHVRPSPPRHPQHQTDFHLRVRFSANGAMSVSTTFWSFLEFMFRKGGMKLGQTKEPSLSSTRSGSQKENASFRIDCRASPCGETGDWIIPSL